MEEKSEKVPNKSWFWKWVLNNQIVSVLLISFLILLNLFAFTKVSHLLNPIRDFIGIIAFPLVFAGILFYLLKPGVDFLVAKSWPKMLAVITMLVVAAAVLVAAIFSLVPLVRNQVSDFIQQLPSYYQVISDNINQLWKSGLLTELQTQLNQINMDFIQSMTQRLNGVLNATVSSITNVVGAVGDFIIGLITMPILLFYLLYEGEKLLPSMAKLFPTKSRQRISQVFKEMNDQIASYIRGQVTVAFAVAVMFLIGYSIIGLPYGTTIALLAGALNIIPYLGSFFGMVPALIIGLVNSPMMFLQVLIVFMVEQTIEGRIISPLILGNQLKIHPVTILLILLTAGKMFGLVGLLLGVPGYAVLKVIASHLFDWYKEYSGIYQEEDLQPSPQELEQVQDFNQEKE